YPAQVEHAFVGHPGVADVCVVGVPDVEWGHRVAAVVQPRPGWGARDELRRDLHRYAAEALASYQRPRRIEFVDALPRTETGKLSRAAVRASLHELLATAPGGGADGGAASSDGSGT